MEAFDTWLHPDVEFDEFRHGVWQRNHGLNEAGLNSNVEAKHITWNGNQLQFVIWDKYERDKRD